MADRAGGYLAFVALEQHARHYELFMVALHGEAQAAKTRALEERMGGQHGRR